MAVKTLTQLRAEAQAIRDQATTGANTASIIGTWMDEVLENLDTIRGDIWEFVLDGTYLAVGSALTIGSGIRTKVPIDGLGGEFHSPNYAGHMWNTTTDKLEPIAENDFLNVRFAITGQSDSDPNNYMDVEFEVTGETPPVIWKETAVFVKGAANEQSFNLAMPFFVGAAFLANGGEIYVTPNGAARFWEIAITISRSYTPTV